MIGCWLLLILLLPSVPRHGRHPRHRARRPPPNQLSGHEICFASARFTTNRNTFPDLDLLSAGAGEIPGEKQPQGIATALMKIARVLERQGKLRRPTLRCRKPCRCSPKPPIDRPMRSAAGHGTCGGITGATRRLAGCPHPGDGAVHPRRNARMERHDGAIGIVTGRGRRNHGWALGCNRQRKARNRRHVEQQFHGHSRPQRCPLAPGPHERRADALPRALAPAEAEHHLPFEGMLKLRLARLDRHGHPNDRLALAKRALQ